jgi:hypothetical protein
MKNTRCFILSVLILSSCAVPTLAYYHPDEGRWLSRDPIGENGFALGLEPNVSRNALHRLMIDLVTLVSRADSAAIGSDFASLSQGTVPGEEPGSLPVVPTSGLRDTNQGASLPLSDLYSFVRNGPEQNVDVNGLGVLCWCILSYSRQRAELIDRYWRHTLPPCTKETVGEGVLKTWLIPCRPRCPEWRSCKGKDCGWATVYLCGYNGSRTPWWFIPWLPFKGMTTGLPAFVDRCGY